MRIVVVMMMVVMVIVMMMVVMVIVMMMVVMVIVMMIVVVSQLNVGVTRRTRRCLCT
jgi:hypothetical protein